MGPQKDSGDGLVDGKSFAEHSYRASTVLITVLFKPLAGKPVLKKILKLYFMQQYVPTVLTGPCSDLR